MLVAGLLLIGFVAHRDGLFEKSGLFLEKVAGPTPALLACCLLLVALVTALLNLDTAVVFLTPVLIHAARTRGTREDAFLYGTVLMANASSLYLPGSNLTNLLVLPHQALPGGSFAGPMLAIALTSTVATALGVFIVFGRPVSRMTPKPPTTLTWRPLGIGLVGVVLAAVLMVTVASPAVPVLAVGLVLVAIQLARHRMRVQDALRAVGPAALASLFLLCLALGVLARSWNGPAQLIEHAGRWETTGLGAAAAVLINNLPAAVLLSAHHVPHPRALLLGLNVGPNFAATGSLAAFLWWRAARQAHANPSLAMFSRRGAPLALFALTASLLVSTAL